MTKMKSPCGQQLATQPGLTYAERQVVARIIRNNTDTVSPDDRAEYAARVVERYDHNRLCYWAAECVLHGRCPFNPVCTA